MSYKTVRDNVADRIDHEMKQNEGMFDMSTWGRGCNTASCLAGHAVPPFTTADNVAAAGAENLGFPIAPRNENGQYMETEHPFFTHPLPSELTAWLRSLPDRELTADELRKASKRLDESVQELLSNLNNYPDAIYHIEDDPLVDSVADNSIYLTCGGNLYLYGDGWELS